MKRENVFLLIVMIISSMCLLSCGKKAPPFFPSQAADITVDHLESEWQDGVLMLKGDLNGDLSSVKGCRVYHAGYAPEDSPCRGCPVEFNLYKEIEAQVVRKGGFYCELPFPGKKGIHFFSVSLLDGKGGAGPLSEKTELIINK